MQQANYDVHNPMRHRRVIFDGIPGHAEKQKMITIDPGETVYGVTLADNVVKQLRSVSGDLQVYSAGEAPGEPKPEDGQEPKPVEKIAPGPSEPVNPTIIQPPIPPVPKPIKK